MIKLIVAWDDNFLIGNSKTNKLPWHISEDLQWFKKTTLNNIVVMGKNTWYSLPYRPLKDRENIVITSSVYVGDEVCHCKSLEEVPKLCEHRWPDKDIFIIGGAQLYCYALKLGIVDEIIVTHIYGAYEGNIYFPISEEQWFTGNKWSKITIFKCDTYERYRLVRIRK